MKHIRTFAGFLNEGAKFDFDKEMQKLEDLQIKIAKSADSARRKNRMESWWETSTASKYQLKWEELITRLRGWGAVNNGKTNPEWMEYCKKNRLAYDYDFSDVLA